METQSRIPSPSDVSEEEWAFVAPDLVVMDDGAPQWRHALREGFNGLRSIARGGPQWRLMPHDLPPWAAVYHQTRRWMAAGVLAMIVHDLRALTRLAQDRTAQPNGLIQAAGVCCSRAKLTANRANLLEVM